MTDESAARRAPLLALDHATKSFGAVLALVDGSITLYPGEAHALLGENGAGKSTLVKILAGVHQPDSGGLRIDGEPVVLAGPPPPGPPASRSSTRSRRCFPTSPSRRTSSWAASRWGGAGAIDRRAMNRAAAQVFQRLGVALDPARPARGLSVADQQIVEIAKALSLDAKILVMDEPTAALTSVEVERLFEVMRTLRIRALPCCSSRTASKRSSPAASGSRSCATARSCAPPRSRT